MKLLFGEHSKYMFLNNQEIQTHKINYEVVTQEVTQTHVDPISHMPFKIHKYIFISLTLNSFISQQSQFFPMQVLPIKQ